jgi:hypothetical protein
VLPVRSWRPRVSHLATFVALLVTGSAVVVALPTTAFAGPNEGDIFSAVNSARAAAGLPGYSYAGDLAAAARGQAERMASSGELYHNPNLGSEVGGWSRIGENVAYAGDWRSAHQVLMNSPDHRAQILDSGYTQMGVGTAVAQDGTLWVAQVFRTPSGTSSTPSSGSSTGGGSTDTSTSTGSTYTPPVAVPEEPTPAELLRRSIRDARERVEARQKARKANDPLVRALDYTTVMETLN